MFPYRKRRQTETICTNEDVCSDIVYTSTTTPKHLICEDSLVASLCSCYCSKVVDLGLSEDCLDTGTRERCKTIILNEGIDECNVEPVQSYCCLSCALESIRNTNDTLTSSTSAASTVTTVPTVTTDSTLPATTPVTSTPSGTSETTSVSTSTTAAPTTTSPVTSTDPAPTCGQSDNANSATCSLEAGKSPSGCYALSTIQECCATCTELYYDRKANGYNVEMCPFGNRVDTCADANCDDEQVARECCDECYSKQDVTPTPVVDNLYVEYAVILVVMETQCSQDFNDSTSNVYSSLAKGITASLQSVFSVLPGTQTYAVESISCVEGSDNMVRIKSILSTSATHTYEELTLTFNETIADDTFSIYQLNIATSSFTFAELYMASCDGDIATNCDTISVPGSGRCYPSDALSNCCESCSNMADTLYSERKYIPMGCEYGDKDSACSPDTDCSIAEAKSLCCYTCAEEPENYMVPSTTSSPESSTIPSTPVTTAKPSTTTTLPTTTSEPCLADTKDSCDSFTADPINCYNKASVYDGCCESCNALVRQDLPPECPWGDKELWCTGITEDQCEDTEVFETCCDQCGPHLTTTTATTTTIVLTTTSPCIDTRDNCANLTSLAIGCYDWADECCSSCKDQVRDHLGDDCRFGDKFQYCSATPKDDCDDTNIASECCELCGPAPPTTEASTTTEGTTTSTTTVQATTTPKCENLLSSCGFRKDLCYDEIFETVECCEACAGFFNPDAPINCRYGDHAAYCTNVSRERCLTEARVFTDCCETCDGLIAPPGVCLDTRTNCNELAASSGCYSDVIYNDCCKTCGENTRDDLGASCKWGNQKAFCDQYERDECDENAQLQEDCCALCFDAAPTTTETPTTAEPGCKDVSDTCFEDTAKPHYCYDEGVAQDCCASCNIYRDDTKPDCPFGDRLEFCSSLEDSKDTLCLDVTFRDSCCGFCEDVEITTPMPTETPCDDADECTGSVHLCYLDVYKDICCASCADAFDPDAPDTCSYGDKETSCDRVVTELDCSTQETIRDTCCYTCPKLLATTTEANVSTVSLTTDAPVSTSTVTTCEDIGDGCANIKPFDCYSEAMKESCCRTCSNYYTEVETCAYGDKDDELCEPSMDCSISVLRELCCSTCANYVVPEVVEALYQLNISAVSTACTPGLIDQSEATYYVFKYQIELAVNNVLKDLPGTQSALLVDVKCVDNVVAILEVKSRGLYEVTELSEFLLSQLEDGQLGSVGVSRNGSSLQPLSFESASCQNADISLNCLKTHVLTEPTNCYESEVREQCCFSCSSLFYSRLSSGMDIGNCPYGDRNAECFTDKENIDCSDVAARETCCDTCSGVTTTTLPPTTTTTTTVTTTVSSTTELTTPSCVDKTPDVCAQAIQNSVSYCYTNEEDCCATCRDKKKSNLLDECAWGDKRDYCESYELANCTTQHIKDTCCELCGEYNVPTTTVQPCVRDADHPECGIIDLSLSLCYDSTFYFLCCNKCNSLRKDYYPSVCAWGDKADYCDGSETICNVHGNDSCCGSCCEDCVIPTTQPPTTPIPTTTLPTPDGCSGDDKDADCESLTDFPMNCYQEEVANLCCQTCHNLERIDLPESCPYGNQINACQNITLEQCDVAQHICCETCFNLQDITCDVSQELEISNCEKTVGVPGSCYNEIVLTKCCLSCKSLYDYDLPVECRFGDKEPWCNTDITNANIDYVCSMKDVQSVCCGTCHDYIGLTTPTPTTVPTTTTTNEQCPEADASDDCADMTSGTGACYDPEISAACSRTCCETYREDLNADCRYGDKSKYCTTVESVDMEWCLENGETCCARCAEYLTTTVPTTTLPPQCLVDDEDTSDSIDCSAVVQRPSDCYSPVREKACCAQCLTELRPDLPQSCRYGDKADYCRDLSADQCEEHSETCCHRCYVATTTTTTIVGPTTTAAPTTTQPPTTTQFIERPSAHIGRGLFNRPVPPGDITLYQVFLTVDESCSGDITDVDSSEFQSKESAVCLELSRRLWSMTACYVQNILACKSNSSRSYDLMILVDRSLNYDNAGDLTANKLRNEILAPQRRVKRDVSFIEAGLSVRDVNECAVTSENLKNQCDSRATCSNTEGLYECECEALLEGDGFTCLEVIDPVIGRRSFARQAPPYYWLYEVELNLERTGTVDHKCFDGMNNDQSAAFIEMEERICLEMASAMISLHSCYVEDFNCDGPFKAVIYVLIDVYINYANQETSSNLLKRELENYNGVISSKLIRDVDECNTEIQVLRDQCSVTATCSNDLPGIYTCKCNDDSNGDGFTCSDDLAAQATGSDQTGVTASTSLADWAIALIIVGAVVAFIALMLAIVCLCRYTQNKNENGLQPLNEGETTPPRVAPSLPPFYNSMRSMKAPHSEVGSYFFAQQERELPGYAMKTYSIRDGEVDPTIYTFE